MLIDVDVWILDVVTKIVSEHEAVDWVMGQLGNKKIPSHFAKGVVRRCDIFSSEQVKVLKIVR